LPLKATKVEVRAVGGIARVVLRQRFVNDHDEPLSVRYQLPLPADGAVSGYAFELDGRRVVGEVDKKKKARERYEDAIMAGRSAALLEQDRSSLFNQEIGNVPPGEEIATEVVIDQKLSWTGEGRWQWRFPTVVAPRYQGAAGRVADAARQVVAVSSDPLEVRAHLALRIDDALCAGGRRGGAPESSTHAIAWKDEGSATQVRFDAEEGARLDRDIVVSWPVATPEVGATLRLGRAAADEPSYGLVSLVPPAAEAQDEPVARDLIVLLDTSGSMGGEPLDQARRIVKALIDTMSEDDSLEMVEFSWRPTRWTRKAQRCNAKAKKKAFKWLDGLRASGGTEMHAGIVEALRPLRDDAQRQIVLVTDGLIGFEDEIVRQLLDELPRNARLHTVGVGSAVNRSLTQAGARAGRGFEVIVGLGEDPERAARKLVAHTAAPLVVELELSGSALREQRPMRLPDLFAGSPALVSLALEPAGGELVVRGRTRDGHWQQRIEVAASEPGSGNAQIRTLFGRELVEDLEMQRAIGKSVDADLEEAGIRFQIATRMTSWVAVSEDETVDARDPSRKVEMPHELPHGMSVEGLGLRACIAGPPPAAAPMSFSMNAPMPPPGPPAMQSPPRFRSLGAPPPPPGPAGPPPGARFHRAAAPPQDELADDELAEGDFDAEDAATGEFEAYAPPPPELRSPAARPAKKGRGVLGRLVDGARGLFGGSASHRLKGRVALQRDDQLVIEIDVDDKLLWQPGTVHVALADGTTIELSIDRQRTTRAGDIGAGQTVRLALKLDAPLAALPLGATLECGASTIEVEL
jgi:Ca-activated chloride channel family protein